MSGPKFTIFDLINGMMLQIIHFTRKSIFLWFKHNIYLVTSTVYLRKIYGYSVASTNEAAFVIGGSGSDNLSNVIAKFENNGWSKFGNLQKSRALHGSITIGTETMIIGGMTNNGS